MLLAPEQFAGFLAAAVLITVSPGPDNLMVLGVGVSRGRAHGIAFGLGCGLGCLSHTLLVVLGVGALIAASPAALTVLKIAGGLYLLRLGIQSLRSRRALDPLAAPGNGQTRFQLFVKGLVANAINPKVILFFLSFLPQFVRVDRGHPVGQMAQLGLVFTLQAAALFCLLGYFSGSLGQWLQRHARAGCWLDRLAGAVFVGLGLRLMVVR